VAKIISFAYTTPALLAGRKTCTRRDWDAAYAARFHRGDLVRAYDRSPRFGGRHVADIVLTADPVLEPIAQMPASDYEAEGFAYLHEHAEALSRATVQRFGTFAWEDFERWRQSGVQMWVVRFRLERVLGNAKMR